MVPFYRFISLLLGCLAIVAVSQTCSGQNSTRVTGGLQVIYDFAGDGSVIRDRSGIGNPLDLRIGEMNAVRRGNGSLEVRSPVTIRSERAATKVIDAIGQSGEITIEAWVQSAAKNQSGPARIVTLSKHTTERNFTLGQDSDRFDVRFRTSATDSNGLPSLAAKPADPTQLSHVVYTRGRNGQATVYLNGAPSGRRDVAGSLSNWNRELHLALANEATGDRPWRGTYHLVAIYSRVLNAGEVRRNFESGHGGLAPAHVEAASNRDDIRVGAGLLALYDFRESGGNLVKDRSGTGDPIDLRIENPQRVRWDSGVLTITGDTVIRSRSPAKRLSETIKRTGAVSIEAWIRPANLNQKGPARIVTMSKDPNERNFTLGQEGDRLEVRLRTSDTSTNGIPSIQSASRSLGEKLSHVVYTRSRGGQARMHVDGRVVAEQRVAGSMGNWNRGFELALANEMSGDRPWKGELHLVAIYGRDLTSAEIARNHRAGPRSASVIGIAATDDARARHFETEIAPILSQHCLECHDSASRKGGLDLSRKQPAFAGGESGVAIVAGKSSESLLWETVEDDVMPQDRPALSTEEKKALQQWIDSGAAWTIDYVDPAIYRNVRQDRNWIQRLTLREYIETVRATMGVDIEKEAREILPQDKRADGFQNTAYNLTVDLRHVEAYAKLAELIVQKVDAEAFARRFSSKRRLIDDDMRELIQKMGAWVLRGPLQEHEVVVYRGISTTVASAGGDFREAVSMVLEAMLQSPRFLYRIESQIGDGSRWPLGDHELASRMSYILWGASPDEALFKAAESGDLSEPERARQHVTRMLDDPRARRQSQQFVTEWLDLDRLDHMRPGSDRFPNWQPELAQDMRDETIAFFLDLVWDQNRPMADLLDAQFTYATPRLARHYGLEPGPDKGDELAKYELSDVPSRGGLLTHGSVLTIGGDEASMVTRGLFVLNDLLFSEVGDPPPGLDTTPVPPAPGRSHRAIATERIESVSCGGCHSRIEPLAFGLEKFDGLGSFHEVDQYGNDLREDGEILFPGEAKPVAYKTSAEMMELLAASDRVSQCLTRKVTQFALGRPLFASDAADVRQIHQASIEAGGTYRSLMTAIILSDLVQRTETEPGE